YAAFHLAGVLEKIGELERAEYLLREVVARMPEFSSAFFDLGRILSHQGKKAEARFFLGKFNLYEGKLDLAQANFKEVIGEPQVDPALQRESETMLELIERLKKG
ncbi:MAG: hypothetical protein V2J11_04995, partial [Desulfofustis sp.]|nr:hypothetical protein [Desulfofustis sp.]